MGWLVQMLALVLVGVTAVRVGCGRMRIDQAFVFFLKWPLTLALLSVIVVAAASWVATGGGA
jgi:NADH:ubiquinone oxidoreductase subunit H